MAVRGIVAIGDPVLRTPGRPVTPAELEGGEMQTLIDDLIDTMRAADGAGIAAQQVGVAVRICVIGVDRNPRYPYKPPIPLTVLVNPQLTPLDRVTFRNNEGCLSVPLRGDLPRFMAVEVTAVDRRGEPLQAAYRGLSAGTVQHELDHLDGTLIVDRVDDTATLATWEMFDRHQRHSYLAGIRPVIEATEPKSGEPRHDETRFEGER